MPSQFPSMEQDLTSKVRQLERELLETRQQQLATSEILRVISKSQTNIQNVFDTITANAVTLCGARQGAVYLYDGKLVHLGAHRNYAPEIIEILRRMYPRPPQSDQVSGRAILTGAVAQIEDMEADPLYARELTLAGAWRSQLAVPMFRSGAPIGAIVIARPETGLFPIAHIELLKTFADQAVIAIENARLFEQLQKRTIELQESLEHQTATSEVLGVISRSTFDLKPVLDVVCESATRLCGASRGHIFRFDGEYLRVAASCGAKPEFMTYLYPTKPGTGSVARRAALERRTINVPDVCLVTG